MGYDVHITRKENWFDELGHDISLAEWLAYVQSDPEMRLDGFAEAKPADGSGLMTNDASIAVWTHYSKHGLNGNQAWFYLGSGSIIFKNPDREILQKMFQIASVLGAQVQGDDGEYYGVDGYELNSSLNQDQPAPQRPWWKFWG